MTLRVIDPITGDRSDVSTGDIVVVDENLHTVPRTSEAAYMWCRIGGDRWHYVADGEPVPAR